MKSLTVGVAYFVFGVMFFVSMAAFGADDPDAQSAIQSIESLDANKSALEQALTIYQGGFDFYLEGINLTVTVTDCSNMPANITVPTGADCYHAEITPR